MVRAHDGEVPAVGRRNSVDAEASSDRGDRCVGAAEAQIGVLLDEIGHAVEVSSGQLGKP